MYMRIVNGAYIMLILIIRISLFRITCETRILYVMYTLSRRTACKVNPFRIYTPES